MAKTKPGFMLYFDSIRPALNRLSDAQAGVLLRSLVDYGEYGVLPETEDPMVGISFDTLRPKLDRDGEKYEKKVLQRQYAAYAREIRRQARLPISFEAWCQADPTTRNGSYLTTEETENKKETGSLKEEGKGTETGECERERENAQILELHRLMDRLRGEA